VDLRIVNVEGRRGGEYSHRLGQLLVVDQVYRACNRGGVAGRDREGGRRRRKSLQGLPRERAEKVCTLNNRTTTTGVMVANVAKEPSGEDKESPWAGVNEGEGKGEA
jgi:hypothetical protein